MRVIRHLAVCAVLFFSAAFTSAALAGWFYGNTSTGSFQAMANLQYTPWSGWQGNASQARFDNRSTGLQKALYRTRRDYIAPFPGCVGTDIEYSWNSINEGNPQYWTKVFSYSSGYCAKVRGQNLAGGTANLAAGLF